ncbi:MAG: Holliday junction resolvase RuvX [Armatimonadetes bacterium]|nr:Holliday junction resolvase RuvX [Armatimonadota bacterium]
MRLLGVDFGGAKIGIAVVDASSKVSSPRPPLAATGKLATDAAAIAKKAKEEESDVVVIGLPLDAGGETKMSRICRQLGSLVQECGVTVRYVDESLTSHAAETDMLAAGLKGSQRRKLVDGEAACRILDRYLEADGRPA